MEASPIPKPSPGSVCVTGRQRGLNQALEVPTCKHKVRASKGKRIYRLPTLIHCSLAPLALLAAFIRNSFDTVLPIDLKRWSVDCMETQKRSEERRVGKECRSRWSP